MDAWISLQSHVTLCYFYSWGMLIVGNCAKLFAHDAAEHADPLVAKMPLAVVDAFRACPHSTRGELNSVATEHKVWGAIEQHLVGSKQACKFHAEGALRSVVQCTTCSRNGFASCASILR